MALSHMKLGQENPNFQVAGGWKISALFDIFDSFFLLLDISLSQLHIGAQRLQDAAKLS